MDLKATGRVVRRARFIDVRVVERTSIQLDVGLGLDHCKTWSRDEDPAVVDQMSVRGVSVVAQCEQGPFFVAP